MLSIYLNIAFAAYFTAMIFYFMELFFKSKLLPNIARLFLVCGILSLTVYMGLRWHIAGRPPLSNMFESLVVFAWAIAVVFIFIDIKYKIKTIAAPVALMSLITLEIGRAHV